MMTFVRVLPDADVMAAQRLVSDPLRAPANVGFGAPNINL
jgi:hypothetical protein